MTKKIYLLLLTVLVFGCTSKKYQNLKDGLYAEIQTNKGDILLELYFEDTPLTVANFVALAEGTHNKAADSIKGEQFYNGIRFHRVVDNFIIQAGDPTETGKGTAGYRFGDEFPKNSNGNLLYKHDDAGILSMANGGPNSNRSQFFITHRDIPHLDEKHTVFGKTIVNSEQLSSLQKSIKDSIQLEMAIDSLRMQVVNNIKQLDTIHTIKIIRVGEKADAFEEGEVFDKEFDKYYESQKNRKAQEKKVEEARYSKYLTERESFYEKMGKPKAKKYDTGLSILKLTENPSGKKVIDSKPVKSHFTLYTADGKKIQSTRDSGQPFVFQLNDAQRPMITGFKEGVSKMRVGEKARLFIPYSIGFGPDKYGPFPAKSDLMFEIEILEIGK
ncbi:peptidylprolyl isomerase [Polaribacter porphyrae]|uniref:peptidylprolyl isomerase n=1 Tax=Polaribacter porphyrae TaxID=1137780 RepID=A0A2S7WKR7_9FLAO|nr:peptidylprolyl isomerase [Polaribacter porphyrae]PQJ78204.1 peptidylprolyl isomerase [Polaribacter porphyrae]